MTQILSDRTEWLKLRKNFLGASDAPVVLGVSPWKTPYQLWQEKLGMRADSEDNQAMKYGRDTEEAARLSYEKYTGNLMHPEVIFHPSKKFMMATLDGLSPNGDMAVEIKCPGEQDHLLAKAGKVPEHYVPQLQHQLACLNINQLHYFSYRDGEGVIVEVEKDDAFIEKLYSEEGQFWKCVLDLEAPEMTHRDYENFELSEEWKDTATQWISLQKQLKALEEKEKLFRNRLIKMAGETSALGHGVRLTKILRKGNVDYKAIPELIGVDLDKYRKEPIESWRLATC
jgi:putative phage-type endonuclease